MRLGVHTVTIYLKCTSRCIARFQPLIRLSVHIVVAPAVMKTDAWVSSDAELGVAKAVHQTPGVRRYAFERCILAGGQ